VVQVNSQSRYTVSKDSNRQGWASNLANSCKTRLRTQGDRTATRFCSEHRSRYTISRLESSVIDRQNFQQLSFNVGQIDKARYAFLKKKEVRLRDGDDDHERMYQLRSV
jgi:hypothetical protein